MNRTKQLQTRVATLRRSPQPTVALVDALNDLGSYLFVTDEAASVALAEEAEQLARALAYPVGIGYAQTTLAFITGWRGNPAAALEQAQHLWREYSDSVTDARLHGVIQELHAASYHRLGQVGNALAHALLALDLYTQAQDNDGIATVLNLIGICYSWLDDTTAATPYLQRALALHELLNDDRRVVIIWGNLTWNYVRGVNMAEALHALSHFEAAYEHFYREHAADPYNDFQVYLNLNRAYVFLGQAEMERAYGCVVAGIAANRREDGTWRNPAFQCALYRAEGLVYMSQSRFEDAAAAMQAGLTLAAEYGILREQVQFHEPLTRVYKALGDYERALAHHEWFHTQDKEIFSTRTGEQVAHLRTTLETKAARREAELLAQKREELEALVHELQTLHDEVHSLTIQDGLTGLFNRRYLDEQLPRLVALAHAQNFPISLVMADIDNFKLVNDTHRHQTGDVVLQVVGQQLQAVIDEMEAQEGAIRPFAARYGGEELVLVLPTLGREAARRHAERFRVKVAAYPWGDVIEGLQVTVSVGVWGLEGERTPNEPDLLLRRTDEALYMAKRLGKNRVV